MEQNGNLTNKFISFSQNLSTTEHNYPNKQSIQKSNFYFELSLFRTPTKKRITPKTSKT